MLLQQIVHFITHLRWHYQLFILSGGYLLSALYVKDFQLTSFVYQFLNVHLLLFGGATAFNSFWDKDEGPVGGLKHPPKMTAWMRPASLLLQCTGLIFAYSEGFYFMTLYLLSFWLFWAYSTPVLRWKGRPLKSIFVIGVSTGTNSFLMGYIAGGGVLESGVPFAAAAGVALTLVSMYPVSQIFQIQEDRSRGDVTFASVYGIKGVYRFFAIVFPLGVFFITSSLMNAYLYIGLIFALISSITWIVILFNLKDLTGIEDEYEKVMRLKLTASLGFVVFITVAVTARHFSEGINFLETVFT